MVSVSTSDYTAAVMAAQRQAAQAGLPQAPRQVVPVEVTRPTTAGSTAIKPDGSAGHVIDVLV